MLKGNNIRDGLTLLILVDSLLLTRKVDKENNNFLIRGISFTKQKLICNVLHKIKINIYD